MRPEWVLWPVLCLAVAATAVTELRHRQPPAWLAVVVSIAALTTHLFCDGVGSIERGLVSSVLGAVGCAGPFAVLALVGARVGWADVRLLSAVGAGLGLSRALAAVLFVSLVGAVMAVGIVFWRRRKPATVQATTVDRSPTIPYGLPIALGTFWAMAWVAPADFEQVHVEEAELVESLDGGVDEPW